MADGQEQRKSTDRERQVQNVNDFTGGADHAAGLQAGKTADGTGVFGGFRRGHRTGQHDKITSIRCGDSFCGSAGR